MSLFSCVNGQQCFFLFYHFLDCTKCSVHCVAVKGVSILLNSTSSFQIHRVYTPVIAANFVALKAPCSLFNCCFKSSLCLINHSVCLFHENISNIYFFIIYFPEPLLAIGMLSLIMWELGNKFEDIYILSPDFVIMGYCL